MRNLYCFVTLLIYACLTSTAQISNDEIINLFEQNTEIPSNNIFLHLNKAVLLKGEDLGFAAYVYDHNKQIPAVDVKNLYCQILDDKGAVIKEQLILVNRGKATGSFVIDSTMQPGNFTVRAFTNWMRNFKTPLYFEAPIKVILENEKNDSSLTKNVNVQILPESGHLVENVFSTIGISVLDNRGRALVNPVVKILENERVINSITLDNNGLGRFVLKPDANKSYTVAISNNDFTMQTQLPDTYEEGVILAVREAADLLYVQLNTNDKTLSNIKGENFTIAIGNTVAHKVYEKRILFNENVLGIKISDLEPGMNQITLFSPEKKVIGQRLHFNFKGFESIKTDRIIATRDLDSLHTTLRFSGIKKANISVSILPAQSIAIDKSQSILQGFKLNPYLKLPINYNENYLGSATPEVKATMENLLLTHGWVMHDWTDIFVKNKVHNYSFEQGITVNANLNNSNIENVVIYASKENDITTVKIEEGNEYFSLHNYIPVDNEKLVLSAYDKKGKNEQVKLYPQYFPSIVPPFQSYKSIIPIEFDWDSSDYETGSFVKESEMLDTVVLLANKERERRAKIKDRTFGRVRFWNDSDRKNEFDIANYLNKQPNIGVKTVNGQLDVKATAFNSFGNERVVLILDGVVFFDLNFLKDIDMATIDYFELVGSDPLYPQAVALKFVTNRELNPFAFSKQTTSSYDVPLTFTAPKKFYKPTYYSYTDTFFEKFGVIDWQGDVEVVDGKAVFSMPYLGIDKLLLHIQGWTPDGMLIDEIKEVTIETTTQKF